MENFYADLDPQPYSTPAQGHRHGLWIQICMINRLDTDPEPHSSADLDPDVNSIL
jgi:hypothetical protein